MLSASRRGWSGFFCSFILSAISACSWTSSASADERIWIEAKINGKPAKLIFDTGASEILLWRRSAEKFGLKVSRGAPDPNESTATLRNSDDQLLSEWTEEADLTAWDTALRYSFGVLDTPDYLDSSLSEMDGLIGWRPFRNNIFLIDAAADKAVPLDRVPKQMAGWTRLHISTNDDVVILEVPNPPDTALKIRLDTGDSAGVYVSSRIWREWRAAHPKAPTTLAAAYTPKTGKVTVMEESWADAIRLGSLTLKGVPIKENIASGSSWDATIGLAALKRLDCMIDGKRGVAYMRAKKTAAPPYSHNRIGAVFAPPEAPESGELVAHALTDSPAYAAGVRDGDRLLKIDGHDLTKWNADPNLNDLINFEDSDRKRISCTLKRGDKTVEAIIVPRRILGPMSDPPNP